MDMTDIESESDTFPKSIGYLKSDRVGFKISLNNSTLTDGEICCSVFFTF